MDDHLTGSRCERAAKAAKIAELNDQLRKHSAGNGRVMVTQSVRTLGPDFELAALLKVRAFDAFSADNDPYGERDYGSFDLQEHRVLWKIDYYNPSLTGGSEDPSNPLLTHRVLTIMLAEDY
jgi:hypothetical protein